ncbi:hypothetical protein LGN12_23985 [Burkholderia multivorans]|nr:hypothetical protein [Burkholderia multivorans]
MATVTIDLGFGKLATLTRATDADRAQLSTEQRSAVSEFMLHWPKYEGLATNARSYLRQLGLDALRGVPLDALRSAIEAGRVAVEIDRKVVVGGSGAGGQPSARPFPLANRLASASPVAALPLDKPLPSWATPSDVSADELISYLESVVAGTGSGLASEAPQLADSLDAGTSLGDAEAFDYAANPLSDDVEQLAASTNNPNYAAKMLGYDRATFGDMIHSMKDDLNLGGADNVIWHDNGDVEFKKQIIGNMHDYK